MLYPSINVIRTKADSRYTIVIMAAKRARDIIDGKPVLTDTAIDKPVSIAAHEIAEDLITYKRPEDNSEQPVDAKAETTVPAPAAAEDDQPEQL